MEPLSSRCCSRNASSQVAITSTIASPIATTSNSLEVTCAPLAAVRAPGQRQRLREARKPLRQRPMTSEVTAAVRDPQAALDAEPTGLVQMPRSLFAFAIFYGG